MDEKLVSIVMSTYQGERYLRPQIESILGQTYQHFELIVVDDASTDQTLNLLGEYAVRDVRIKIFPGEKNIGLVANFERGLMLASGEFIALSDQDDIFDKNKIATLVQALKNQPERDLVISDASLINAQGDQIHASLWQYQKLKPVPGKSFRRLLYINFVTGCTMMIRRRLLQRALPFPPHCLIHDSWLAIVSASHQSGGICLVDSPLTAYRQHGANIVGAEKVVTMKWQVIIARLKNHPRVNRQQHIARLAGYLERDIWLESERSMINETKLLFEGYMADSQNGLFRRLIKIPRRVRYAATTGRIDSCIAAIFFTIWPYE